MTADTSSPRRLRVLVIEDSTETRRLMTMGLAIDRCDVVEAVDGVAGLEAAMTDPPDVIVLDIGLPGLGGWDVLDRLRSNPDTAHVPVLVCTAHDTPGSREQADNSQADAFLGKPFDLNDLRSEVRRLASTVSNSSS